MFLVCIIGASKDDFDSRRSKSPPLVGTKWQLIAFVDVENDTSVPPKSPPNFPVKFWISFLKNNEINGGGCNKYYGMHSINFDAKELSISIHAITEINCVEFDEELFLNSLEEVQSFDWIKEKTNTLLLYYNDGKNYLKLKEKK